MADNAVATEGAPRWIDLFSSDTAKAEEFYGALFGWTAESAGPEYGGYVNFSLNGELVAGCMKNDGSTGGADAWSLYLGTGDAAATAAAVSQYGGTVLVPPMQVMDLGTMAVFTDAGGAAIGTWQPGSHKGFGVVAVPGAPAWFELHTRDYPTTVQFYRDAFHWDTEVVGDTDQFRYTTLSRGDMQQAGIMDVSAFPANDFPVRWSIYFAVEDADAAIAKATQLGATLVQGPDDSPYGRLASLTDPTGARFKIVAG